MDLIQHRFNSVNAPEGTTHIEKATQPPGTWQEVTVGINILLPRDINAEDKWTHCSYVIAESGDKCKPDSWVFFRSPCDSPPMVDEVCVPLVNIKTTFMINFIIGICGKNCFDPPAKDHQQFHCSSIIGHLGTISHCAGP